MNNFENTNPEGTVSNEDVGDMNKNVTARKPSRMKIGLIVAIVAQVAWVLAFIFYSHTSVSDILGYLALITTAGAYIIGGGLIFAFKTAWGIAKKMFFFGWLVVPFPMDILTGLISSLVGIFAFLIIFLFLPLLLVFLNYKRVQNEA